MASTLADRPALPRRLSSRRKKRHGIILLMVVSLLALFLLMGVTFAILAIQYKQAADVQAQKSRYGDPPVNETELVLNQVLFDASQNSSLTTHSLLRDFYGNDYVMCPVNSTSLPNNSPPDLFPQFGPGGTTMYAHEPVGGQQFMRITLDPTQTFAPTSPGRTISQIPGYYNGRVLTVYVAQARQWISTRIAHYVPPTNTPQANLYVEQLVGPTGAVLLPDRGAPFVINGLPFNGTGSGYDATNGTLNARDPATGAPIAFLPHISSYQNVGARYAVGLGGLDESWDAADYQNMFLAFVPTDLSNTNIPLIPSYMRPELLNYWRNNGGSLGATPDPTTNAGRAVLRQIIFRPMPWDHPNFTGGNPYFTGNNYTLMLQQMSQTNNGWERVWDVDNDGDGVPDSIWIDPGLPVLTAPNGRRYKRLAAILIKDLDGRVNVNVAGNLAGIGDNNARAMTRVNPSSASAPPLLFAGVAHTAPSPPPPALPQLHPYLLPRGLGYGPAEIDFAHIFRDTSSSARGYSSPIATSQYQGLLQGRYGNDGVPGSNAFDVFSASKTLGMADNHFTTTSNYNTPPDVWGRGTVAMDYYGRPGWLNMGYNETIDDPYEMEFNPDTAINDTPYNISDMERLLRYPDNDSNMLSSRLLVAAGGNAASYPIGGTLASSVPGVTGPDRRARESLTTMSSHVPVPRTFWRATDGRQLTNPHPSASVLDLYYAQLQGSGNLAQDWRTIVPWEFQHGEMFNLNRLFGNGQEDGGIPGIIDDPSEPMAGEMISGSLQFDHLNDSPGLASIDPRQLYARHLYCLLMLLKPTGYYTTRDLDGDGQTGVADPGDTARLLAQYAINVVDFRDNDSICTGFEYDANPFDGWQVDGNLATVNDPAGQNRAVVWGVERPELMITETLAFHDRRTEDSAMSTEMDIGTTTDPDNNRRDQSFDQRLRPKGRFFFELFNPWVDRSNGAYEKAPPELYNGGQGVVLSAMANGSPVWRVKVIKGQSHTTGRDPDLGTPDSVPAADVDRTIYFTDVTGQPFRTGENVDNRFYPTDPIAPVLPGRYAVAGSSGMSSAGPTYTTYVGRNEAGKVDSAFASQQANMRRIIIRPNGNPNAAGQFEILSNSATQMNLATVQPVVGIAINRPRSLNLSEPPGGYDTIPTPMANWDNTAATPDEPDGGAYRPQPYGTPLDSNREDDWADQLLSNRTYTNKRTLCLQRLANPRQPWNAQTNPYITIDTSSVDVTAFNGLDAGADPQNQGAGGLGDVAFSTLERGGERRALPYFDVVGPPPAARVLWRTGPNHIGVLRTTPADATHVFRSELVETLGYLNSANGQPYTNTSMPATTYVGAPQATGGATNAAFPWLVFNNRPFMSPAELLHVPATSQSQLLVQFNIISGAPPTNVYDNSQELDQVFGHLPNFLRTNNVVGTIGATDGPLLARLLDYVEIPSRFVGTERFYSPNPFSTATAPGNNPATSYRAPFNHLSRFRDPGRVNLNTFADEMIWSALVGDYSPGTSPPPALQGWSRVGNWTQAREIDLSRQGYASATPGQINNGYPSIFSNPFRATEAADLMPNVGVDLRKREAEAGLLRPQVGSNDPLLAASLTNAREFVDPARSAFHRYFPLQKVANNVTTNSNCFAVWITVGYFEVEDNPSGADLAHPDGYMLGQELGLDIGDTQRHRAFYLIDRSIPAGFIPGVKLNTDNVVLLRRQIE